MTRLSPFLLLAALPALLSAQESPTSSSCPCSLRGTVINSVTGAPVPGALVQSNTASQPATLTDSEGSFHFDGLPAGTLSISATKPGFLPQYPFQRQSTSVPVGPDAPPAVIKLTPGGVLTGRVFDERGEPLENFNIRLIRRAPFEGDLNLYILNAKAYATNDLGVFRVPDLPAGSYLVLVSPPNVQSFQSSPGDAPLIYPALYYPGVLDSSAATRVKVTAGHEAHANFTVSARPAIRLSGSVVGILPGALASLAMIGSFSNGQSALINFDRRTGAFQTGWIPPGTYHLIANSTDPRASQAGAQDADRFARFSVTAELSLNGLQLVLAPLIHIPVHVRGLSQTGDANRIWIRAASKEGEGGQAIPLRSAKIQNEFSPDGYEIQLAPGTYRLEVSPYMEESYYVESATLGSSNLLNHEFTADSSAARSSIEIVLLKGAAAISGTVTMKDVSRAAYVCIFPPSPRTTPVFVLTNLNGGFKLDHIAPGSYRIVAVDGLTDLDPSNQELIKKLSSAAKDISLAPQQSISLALELSSLPE